MSSRPNDRPINRLAWLLPALVAMLCVVLSPVSVACASAAAPPSCPMAGSGACCCAHGADHALASTAGCDADTHSFTACTMRTADPSAAVPAPAPAFVPVTAAIVPERVSILPSAPLLCWRPFAHVRSHAADASPPPLPSRAPPAFSA